MMTTGVYPSLPNSTSIRALRFEVLPDKNEIRGQLVTIDLEDEHHPKYEALSYAWGDPSPITYATFVEYDLQVGIAQNLADGLARLHKDGQSEPIWIDAVCIDQRDLEERSQQVQMMGRIYGEATQVKIWLGLSDEEMTAAAFARLKQCANPLDDSSDGRETLENMGGLANFKATSVWSNSMLTFVTDLDFQISALNALFGKSWFRRLWVVQEVWFGRELTFRAGAKLFMEYDILCRGFFFL